ncbi:polysaccharide deacetylase family protein [Fodinicola acaciae]|uniref:polysaccharide deacetylase family protein n=1 Tax=Fodinicola acaciae TaxID=2681555 RepID=UPI001C9E45B6|nr:polysaccharide deacetylase family protein [Fodinicola acaciae]
MSSPADALAQDRRRFLGVMALGLLGLAGCGASPTSTPTAATPARLTPSHPAAAPTPAATGLPPIPPPRPGVPELVNSVAGKAWEPPKNTPRVILTVDDGYDAATVAAYAEFASRTGIPLTFNPNGTYQSVWNPHAKALAPLIEKGQVQIGNHTFTHKNLLGRPAAAIREDIERNEAWINKTFGITSRPYFRPPFGAHNKETDGVVASLGYTKILLWDGTLGDSKLLTPDRLLYFANEYLTAGRIILGHANHPTITHMFDKIENLIKTRKLEPVTLDTAFGTSRATG